MIRVKVRVRPGVGVGVAVAVGVRVVCLDTRLLPLCTDATVEAARQHDTALQRPVVAQHI